ncbi:unnamed protein product [Caenorhabditis sp. 36 PRJEB53466]|nr:unnamed protein product [Caenorhabditis sp. 36 PRJEB53466]
MAIGDYLILVQNLLLIFVLTSSTWIQCKKKKAVAKTNTSKQSKEKSALVVQSAIHPPVTDVTPSAIEKVKEEKKEEAPKEEVKEKEGEKKDGAENPEKKVGKSQKTFPKFEMPTESKKKMKLQENEAEKKEKIKNGFFQEKSDEDDTLEKIDSLKVEQSDRTKRSQKKKK